MRSLLTTGLLLGILSCSLPSSAAESDVAGLIKSLSSPTESARINAIDRLGRAGPKAAQAVEALTGLLEDDSAKVRAHAAKALGDIGKPALPAVKALASLITDEDAHVRRAAVEALDDIEPGPEVGVPIIVKMLEDADPAARIRALHALADEGKTAVPHLIDALAKEEAAYWACLVLSEIGPDAEDAVPALTKVLEDKRLGVRREAILALAAIGEASAPATDALVESLDCEVNGVVATYAMGKIGRVPPAAKKKILKNARSEDGVLATVSLWALARLNPDDEKLQRRSVRRLAEFLKSDDPKQRVAAAQALIELDPDPEISRPIIKKVMDGASPEVLDTVLDAVASLGEKALPRMIEALKAPEVRARVASIIARIGPKAKQAVPALVEALADPEPETRNEVLFALGSIGPGAESAVPAVAKALGDPDMNVRYAACYALGSIGPAAKSAKAALQRNLASPDEFLAMDSAWALSRIDPGCTESAPKTVPLLVKGLEQPDAMTRLHAVESLGRLGPLAKDAAAALKKALEDDNGDVREAAAEALKAIGG
jgi:HEAT repeat protein